jgi:hypothetical protein
MGLILTLAVPTSGWGKIVRYVDANGVIVLTNIPPSPGQTDSRGKNVGTNPGRRAARVQAHPYREEVARLARQHALSPQLVSALMAVESDFNPEALSPKGARGLMQLMPLIARYYQVYDPFDPRQNIEGGVRYLSDLLRLFDEKLPLALAAYNGGEGLVRKHGAVPPFLQSYVDKILTLYEQARYTSIERYTMPTSSSFVYLPAVPIRPPSIYRYTMPTGKILFSNVPLSREQVARWEANE